jgi:hypothetical protein
VTITYPRSKAYSAWYWPQWTEELDVAAIDRTWREVPLNLDASEAYALSGGSMQFAPRVTANDGLFSTELLTIAYETLGYCLDYWNHIPGAFTKLLLSFTNLLAAQYAIALHGIEAQSLHSYAATVQAVPYAAAAILERYRATLIKHSKDGPEIAAREQATILERLQARAAKDREQGRALMIRNAHKRNKSDAIKELQATIKRHRQRMTYHAEHEHQAEHAEAASLYDQAVAEYMELRERAPEEWPLTPEQLAKIEKLSA